MSELEHKNWSGTTDGTPWMQKTLIRWFRHTTLLIPYWCMGWIVPFYMLFRHKGYIASYRLYRHRFHKNPLKAFGYVYANHFRFGQVIVDRFAAYAGHQFHFEVEGQNLFDKLESAEESFFAVEFAYWKLRVGGIFVKASAQGVACSCIWRRDRNRHGVAGSNVCAAWSEDGACASGYVACICFE